MGDAGFDVNLGAGIGEANHHIIGNGNFDDGMIFEVGSVTAEVNECPPAPSTFKFDVVAGNDGAV